MQNKIDNFIKSLLTRYPKCKLGIYAQNSKTKKSFCFNKNQTFGTASVIKIAIALKLFDLFEKDQFNIDKPIKIKDYLNVKNVGEYSNGVLTYYPNNATITMRLACLFMLNLSDNSATNLLLKFISKDSINKYLKINGFLKTRINHPAISYLYQKRPHYNLGLTTPKEIAEIMQGVLASQFLKTDNSRELLSMLNSNYPESSFNRYLPITWNVPKNKVKIIKIYNKTGAFPDSELRSNVLSILSDKKEYITLAVFTQGIKNKDKFFPSNLNPDHPATKTIGRLVKLIFDQLY